MTSKKDLEEFGLVERKLDIKFSDKAIKSPLGFIDQFVGAPFDPDEREDFFLGDMLRTRLPRTHRMRRPFTAEELSRLSEDRPKGPKKP